MAEEKSSQTTAKILNLIADLQKEIGELLVTATAERAALRDLLPGFETRFSEHLVDDRSRQIKQASEQKIRGFREIARKLSES